MIFRDNCKPLRVTPHHVWGQSLRLCGVKASACVGSKPPPLHQRALDHWNRVKPTTAEDPSPYTCLLPPIFFNVSLSCSCFENPFNFIKANFLLAVSRRNCACVESSSISRKAAPRRLRNAWSSVVFVKIPACKRKINMSADIVLM